MSTLTTPTSRVLLALIAGLLAGAAIAAVDTGPLRTVASIIEPIGSLWVRALQMVLIPLVLSLLVTGIVTTVDTGATGRLGATALGVFLALLAGTALVSALVATPLVSRIPIEPETTALMRPDSAVVATARQLPKFSDLIVSTVPANPVRAAVDGAMLPLVTFAILFGLALARIGIERRDAVARVFQALAEAMTVIVGWLIAIAPLGVFALAMTLVVKTGLGAVRAFALYIVLISGVIILVTLLLYAVAAVAGRQPLTRFMRALVPPQAIAFSARSSLAALPAMVESARMRLGFPAPVTNFVLPLAVTTLRLSTPIMWSVSIPFLARLYGVAIAPEQFALLLGTSILMSFSVPGLPSASIFLMGPFLTGLGIPIEAIGLLIAADSIPDLFKGVLNVTGHMTSAAVVTRKVTSA
ncbi:MAG TPA: dicarboxylate/amino acid:cation symporter [Gemmatimonadaceae bacterium]|nr:dicarboxylate/amino acid:cation symporter [Gemmatimonadaceae bacterium]